MKVPKSFVWIFVLLLLCSLTPTAQAAEGPIPAIVAEAQRAAPQRLARRQLPSCPPQNPARQQVVGWLAYDAQGRRHDFALFPLTCLGGTMYQLNHTGPGMDPRHPQVSRLSALDFREMSLGTNQLERSWFGVVVDIVEAIIDFAEDIIKGAKGVLTALEHLRKDFQSIVKDAQKLINDVGALTASVLGRSHITGKEADAIIAAQLISAEIDVRQARRYMQAYEGYGMALSTAMHREPRLVQVFLDALKMSGR